MNEKKKARKSAKPAIIGISGVPAEIVDALKSAARANNRSVSGQVRAMLIEALAPAETAR